MSPKISRRSFNRYLSNSMIAAALSRVFYDTQAFGAVSTKKLIICMNPNGHANFDTTQSNFKNTLNPAVYSKYGQFVSGLKNASADQDWHGGEGAFLSFATRGKSNTPSFFSTLGLESIHFSAVSGNGSNGSAYGRDSTGGALDIFRNPATAVNTIFGKSMTSVNPSDAAAIQAGKMSLIDPCLEDVKSVQNKLGSDKVIFQEYLDSLIELQKRTQAMNSNPDGRASGSTPAFCGSTPKVSDPGDNHERYKVFLDIAYQIAACDMMRIITVAFGDNHSEGYHGTIHGGRAQEYLQWTGACQTRIAQLANQMASGPTDLLQDSAIVYISEGGAHMKDGRFDQGHPTADIPCVIIGKLGGTFSKTGNTSANGGGTPNLYRQIVDGMSNGSADLSTLQAKNITPLGV
ncbi:MAG: DUF1552 domain-containing protein [Oligoflexus sp.]|nr:DUF1552 domain-containing protein [Oligoflexus sp.]